MATSYKVLGQVAPPSTTATTLYTAPSASQAVISTIFVCNRGTDSATFRIAVQPNGAALADHHYIVYNVSVDGNAIIPVTAGITLDDSDVVTVYASSGDLSFSAFGSEITA